jgi:nicotinamide-nucleotide amidase
MTDAALRDRAALLIETYAARGLRIATAESCTGGLVAALLTEIPGSSAVVERGFVTYSNEAKAELLGIDPALIAAHGAVSAEVVRAMAEGALRRSHADIAVAITGIAGPSGATATKPVGLVHFGLARRGGTVRQVEHRFGEPGRSEVRRLAVEVALTLLEDAAD